MHIDLDGAPAGQIFYSTVCVIGGGIAGLILALRLANSGVHVHVLEAGGLQYEQRSQDLYKAAMTAGNHRGSNEGRFRTFGGSSTQWGGQLLPFTPDIFAPPSGSPSLAWPISDEDLSTYYSSVEAILGVNSLPYSADILPALRQPPAPPSGDIVVRYAKWAPFSKRNLANTVGAEALSHPQITVFSHANAVELKTAHDDPSHMDVVSAVNYAREKFYFTASHFVLCAGTVESSRLLLCSSSVPNPHHQVGRYLHDHVAYHAARFTLPASEKIVDRFGPFFVAGTLHSCKFEASPMLRARENLYTVMAHVVVIEPEDSGTAAIRNVLRSIQHGRIGEAIGSNLLPMLRGMGDVVRLLYYSRFKQRRAVSKRARLMLNIDVEQAPNPENRVRLSDTRTDALGLPETVIDWRIGEPEKDTAARFAPMIRDYLYALNLEPSEWDKSVLDHTLPDMLDTNHAMGGLRMGTDPASSVVDTDLRYHGVDNLFVASCAVFPSGSSSNPTFTMMALTLRLADHLVERLSSTGA